MSSSLFMSIFSYQRTLIVIFWGTLPHIICPVIFAFTLLLYAIAIRNITTFLIFFTLSHQWDFIWCLASILLLYSAILKMSILFLNFFLIFFCAFLVAFYYIICSYFLNVAYFLKFFLNNFKHIILTVYSPSCNLSYYYILKLIYLFSCCLYFIICR